MAVKQTEEQSHFGFSGKKLRQARRAKRLSQTELGALVEAHRSSVVRWESNMNEPHKEQLRLLAQVLEKEPAWFFDWGTPSQNTQDTRQKLTATEENIQPLSEALKKAMKRHHDSQFSLARRIGVDVKTLRNWMGGFASPTAKEMKQMHEALGEEFAPSAVAFRKIAPVKTERVPPVQLSIEDKLDLILARLGRIENLLTKSGFSL